MEVRIIAASKEFQTAPFYFSPKKDEKTKKWITGQNLDFIEETKDNKTTHKLIETEASKKLSLVISPDESYVVKHLKRFNTEVESDMILLNFFKTHTDILAPSKKDVKPGVHRFYIEDKEEEAKETISKTELEYKAMTEVKGMSLSEQMDFARALGVHKVGNLTKIQVEAALYSKCKEDPERVLSTFGDPNRKVKAFLRNLVEKNIIRLHAGKYTYGEEIIGLNELSVIDYLKDKANINLVGQLDKLLKEPVMS